MTQLQSTDPYAVSEEPDPDRLGNKPSTTPLMTSSGGMVRVLMLICFAGIIVYGKHQANLAAISIDTNFSGLEFPPEIRVYGSHQYVLGGGAAPFGALGVYVKMTPGRVSSPPLSEWARLDVFAAEEAEGGLAEDKGFFETLASSDVEKSLLLQFDGRTEVASLAIEIRDSLFRSLGAAGSAQVLAALQSTLEGESSSHVPPEAAQLYITCDRTKDAHLAYGAAAKGKKVRNTAPVTASLTDGDFPGVCSGLFDAMLSAAEGARSGVAAGFTEQYGRGQKPEKHDEL